MRDPGAQSSQVTCLRSHSSRGLLTPKGPRFQRLPRGAGTWDWTAFCRLWPLRAQLAEPETPSSRGGGEAEDPVGREPWTGPAVAMGTAGRRRRAEAVAPRGSSGELPPAAGSGRELAPGAAFPRRAEPAHPAPGPEASAPRSPAGAPPP